MLLQQLRIEFDMAVRAVVHNAGVFGVLGMPDTEDVFGLDAVRPGNDGTHDTAVRNQ